MPCPPPFTLFADQSQGDMRPGESIPGYTGHVPRKVSENVYGTTFRAGNEHASVNERQMPRKPSPPCTRQDGSPRIRAMVPGGAGAYSPKDYGARFFSLGNQNAPERKGPVERPKTAAEDASSIPQQASPLSPGRGVPGYQGFVPNVRSENIYGASFRSINEKASRAVSVDALTWTDQQAGNPKGLEIRSHIEQVPRKKRSEGPRSSLSGVLRAAAEDVPIKRSSSSRELSPIPGYSGHVPKKTNVYGTSFRQANEIAFKSEEFANGDKPTEPVSLRDYPRGRESAGEIPSNIHHVPRKALSTTRSEVVLGYPKGRSAVGEIPSHINHVPRKCRSLRNLRCFAAEDSPPAQAPPEAENQRPSRSPSPGRESIPGYSGYIPKVGPRNVFGVRCRVANEIAASETAPVDTAAQESARSCSTLNSPGASECDRTIPGYAGYIPKKGPSNIMGATYRAANERAARGIDPVKEAATETTRLQDGGSVWEPWSTKRPQRSERARSPRALVPAGMIIGDVPEPREDAMLQAIPSDEPMPRRSPQSSPRPAKPAWR